MNNESIGMPNLIPEDLPDEIMMVVVMTSPVLVAGDVNDIPEDLTVGHGVIAGALQVQLNCPLELAVVGLRGLLDKMERDLTRRAVAGNN